jgi:ankyrin repeat protein
MLVGLGGFLRLAAARAGASQATAAQVFPAEVALATAVAADDAAEVHRLVAAGADLRSVGDKGIDMLSWSVLTQSPRALEALLELGADPTVGGDDGRTVIHLAAMAEDPVYLATLLSHGVSPNTRNTQNGAPPIFDALVAERHEHVIRLMNAGYDVNLSDNRGNTALHKAAAINETKVVIALLEAGADPRRKNALGATFQRYLFMTPDAVVSQAAQADRQWIRDWLLAQGVLLEAR